VLPQDRPEEQEGAAGSPEEHFLEDELHPAALLGVARGSGIQKKSQKKSRTGCTYHKANGVWVARIKIRKGQVSLRHQRDRSAGLCLPLAD
jgi:hypothetical protein